MYKIDITNDASGESSTSFLQSAMWAEFKSRHGWKNLRFGVTAQNNNCDKNDKSKNSYTKTQNIDFKKFDCHVLVRSFAKNIFSLAYIPMMPLPVEDEQKEGEQQESEKALPVSYVREYSEFLCDFSKALKKYLPRNTICIRYDLPIDFRTVEEKDFFNTSMTTLSQAEHFPLRKNKVDIQPPDTVLLDITKSEDDILAGMKNKWRYNVRLAQKKGVVVRAVKATDSQQQIDSALEVFYSLYKTTAERDGIAIHSKSYYKDLFSLCAEYNTQAGNGKTTDAGVKTGTKKPQLVTLYTAYHEEDALAAIITLFTENEAVYLYGASSNVKRNLMPAYLLQWTAICDAKNFGSKVYDFYGIPPTNDESHPMHGLYLFKTGFGGAEVHRPGSYDVPTSPLYSLYTVAEDLRAFFFKKIKKIIRGR